VEGANLDQSKPVDPEHLDQMTTLKDQNGPSKDPPGEGVRRAKPGGIDPGRGRFRVVLFALNMVIPILLAKDGPVKRYQMSQKGHPGTSFTLTHLLEPTIDCKEILDYKL